MTLTEFIDRVKTPRIEMAAISQNGVVYTVPCRGRHGAVVRHMLALGISPTDAHIAGFVTNQGMFVDRVEGLKIAIAANQLIGPLNEGQTGLTTEDLW